jgi:preprotein translocase subunit SecA
VLQRLLRLGEGRRLKELYGIVGRVNDLESTMVDLSDAELRARTDEFRRRLVDGATLDDLLPEAFATVREVAKRTLGQRPFDVQVLGGIALHQGDIAEMKTGEGKTLTSTMPVYLNALEGKGVHVVTVNPYLASRDQQWMGRIYQALGLSVGLVYAQQKNSEKREAYLCDITYGTNNEFGFDFLRDHMVLRPEDKVQQQGHPYAIIDEVDSILIDEARTPLIISGPADQATEWYTVFARRIVPRLERGKLLKEHEKRAMSREAQEAAEKDYVVDEAKRTVAVTERGVARVEELLGVENLYESVNTPLIHHLQNAIRAQELYRRDQEYMISDGEVLIVDEFTGRTLPGRRYSEGLHQAIEAKEGVKIKEENQTLATITLQNYFRTYEKLAGMTGTAKTEEAELAHIYNIGVVAVPTNEPVIRLDHADQIFKTDKAKLEAVVEDIITRHQHGQPILVGTISIEKSERLSEMLIRRGIPHEVLNAKNHFKEAAIIAQAGRVGAVTIATNMAGRGVDIMLGGNPEAMADAQARAQAQLEDGQVDHDVYARVYPEALAECTAACKAEGDKVRELGGLYVLGTERHESRRIDNQLRGRSGRQGDPGESRFYLSLEDDLMRLFNAAAVESIMTRLKLPEDVPIEHKMVTRAVARAQAQVESRNFELRKNVLKYDDVMNAQRQVIYAERNIVLEGTDEQVAEFAVDFIDDSVRDLVATYAPAGVFPEEWNLDELWTALERVYPVQVDRSSIDLESISHEELADLLVDDALARYEEREAELTPELMREVERRVILSVVDRIWREHLYEMDHLRDGIGLRGVGQRDPLVEYQREAYEAFQTIRAQIKQEAASYFFYLPVQREPAPTSAASSAQGAGEKLPAAPTPKVSRPALRDDPRRPEPKRLSYTSSTTGPEGTSGDGSASYAVETSPGAFAASSGSARQAVEHAREDKIGRNDPCPCGSGLKYKRCHGG